ncbi:MAG: L,D-transpeptidase family protein [Planctomycetota bacterium]|jgi:LysM repeat protein
MARYPSFFYGRQMDRTRRWIYIVSALLIIAVVIVFIYSYRSSDRTESEISVAPAGVGEETATETPVVLEAEEEAELRPALPEVAPEPVAEPNQKVNELIAEALALINDRPAKICEARDILNEALPMQQGIRQRAIVKEQLSNLADEWLFSRRIFPQDKLCGTYKVKSGDQLRVIGKQYKVPYEVLMKINNISRAEALQAGDTIKVINGPFHTRIYRSTFTMDLYLQNTFVRSFPVGIGKPGMETPTGLWRVKVDGKLEQPVWYDRVTNKTYHPEDPNYPLGSRWIALEGIEGEAVGRTGIAIHGTKVPEEIGTAGSRGCIRLHNGDVILVYDLLMPVHSLVKVEE